MNAEDSTLSAQTPRTFLVTWNPRKWTWDTLAEDAAKLKKRGYWDEPWTCWHEGVQKGDRIFLLAQGRDIQGVVGSGHARGEVYWDDHYADDQRSMPYVKVRWDAILDPRRDEILQRQSLKGAALGDVHWDTQRSGITITPVAAARLEVLWADLLRRRGGGREIAQSELLSAIKQSGLGRRALRYLADPRFATHEMSYKMKLAEDIREADQLYIGDKGLWADAMSRAVGSKRNNLVPWRTLDDFKNWCRRRPEAAAGGIHALIHGRGVVQERIREFCAELERGGITQIGAQVCLASLLLMAGDMTHQPPVRTDVLRFAVKELGLDWKVAGASPARRYRMLMEVLDALVDFSKGAARPLASRLEAQGALWCVKSRWMDKNPNAGEPAGDDTADDEGLPEDETEREALIAARRGQGRFRNSLVSLWLRCAVTGCQSYPLLRASHLKAWSESDNRERLDKFNGLLLTPNLDLLLDQHLVTFDKAGGIVISSMLTEEDRQSLGVYPGMRISRLHQNHHPYLNHHRAEFRRKERIRG